MFKWMTISLLLMTSACVSAASFRPSSLIEGKRIVIGGYLKFEDENMNLYPTENWEHDRDERLCLPVGVKLQDQRLLSEAKRLNGKWVTIQGQGVRIVGENEVTVAHCNDFGVAVESLRLQSAH